MEVLGVAWRGSSGLPDGSLVPDPASRERIAELICRLRPDTVVAVASDRRHPDHSATETLAHDACFVAGLRRKRGRLASFRPRKFLLAAGFRSMPPGLIVDIEDTYDVKERAVRCYRSQFQPGGWRILGWIESRARYFGGLAGIRHAEGFLMREPVLVEDVSRLAGSSF
jgi:LmbE family N-acetylglucosaminyl deacetylase